MVASAGENAVDADVFVVRFGQLITSISEKSPDTEYLANSLDCNSLK